MKSSSVTEAKQGLATLLNAAQRDVGVPLSAQEYARLRQLNSAEFQNFCDRVAKQAASRGMNASVLKHLLPSAD